MESVPEQLSTLLGQAIATSPADIDRYKNMIESQLKLDAQEESLNKALQDIRNVTQVLKPISTSPPGPGSIHISPISTYGPGMAQQQQAPLKPAEVVKKTTVMTLAMILINDILKDHPELVDEYPEQFARLMEYI